MYLKYYNFNSSKHVKVLTILLDTTTNRSVVEQEDLQWYWNLVIVFTIFATVSLTREISLSGQLFLATGLIPKLLYLVTINKISHHCEKQISIRHMLKRWAVYESSSGWQVLRIITEIQSQPDPFEEPRLVMTILKSLELQGYGISC